MRTRTLVDPGRNRDIMGYCSPRWISDYTWKGLVARSAAVNVPSPILAARVDDTDATPWRALLLDGAGRPRWGLPFVGPAHGSPEPAEILDEAGRTVATVDVYRTEVSDTDEFTLLVPPPRAGWHGVRVRGAPPLAFGATPAVQPLRP
jgi:hypothetical protein